MGQVGAGVVLDDVAFVHESAWLYGRVTIGPGSSVWPLAVMRAELHEIRIGRRSNIQDHVVIHVGNHTPTIVGADCSITHHATLHGCEIGDACLIGINATVMDGARIGAGSIVAGHAIVSEGAEFPAHSIIAGVPARQVGERDCSAANVANARFYHAIAGLYARGQDRLDDATLARLKAEAGLEEA
jgi:carbonic anhydrase/acetyltransferase-like protein (isoleucine patch superfamily)